MSLIVKAVKENTSFSKDELVILKNYLSRRLPYINDNPELKEDILEVLK